MELLYAGLIILIVICLLIIAYIVYYNKLQDNLLKVQEAENIIDDSLRKKYDKLVEIKNIIESKFKNKKINLSDLDKLKEDDITNFDLDRKLEEITGLIKTILDDNQKADISEIEKLLNDIKRIDETTTTAKTFYNKYITNLNSLVKKIPSNIIAKIHGIKQKNYYDNKDMNDEKEDDFKL